MKKSNLVKKALALSLATSMVSSMLPVYSFAKEAVTDVDGWVVQRQSSDQSEVIQDGWITPDEDGNGVTIDYGKIVADTGQQGWVVFDSDEEKYKNSSLEFDITFSDSGDGDWLASVISPRVNDGKNYEGFALTNGTGMERSGRRDGVESYAGISNLLGESFQYDKTYHMRIETVDSNITTYLTKDGKEQKLNSFESPIGLEESTWGFRFWRDGKKVTLDNIERTEIVTSGLDSEMEQINESEWGQRDIEIPVRFGKDDSIENIRNVGTELTENEDYKVDDNILTLKKEYIAKQNGNFRLQVNFAKGSQVTLWIMKSLEGAEAEYVWTPDQGIDMWERMEGDGTFELQEDGMRITGRNLLINKNAPLAINGEIEVTFEFLNDNWNRDEKNHGIGCLFRADQETGSWQSLAVDGYVSSQPDWKFINSAGASSEFTLDGDCFVSRDGVKDYKFKERFDNDSITLWMDDQFSHSTGVKQAEVIPGNMGILLNGNRGDVLVKKVVFRELAPMKEETGERQTISIANDGLTVRLDEDFPRVMDYMLNGKTMNGAEKRYNYVTINTVNIPATSEIIAQDEASVTYHVTPDAEKTGVTFDVVFEVKNDQILEMKIMNIVEPEGEQVNSIGLPKQPLISANSTQAGAKFDASWVSKPVNGWGIKDLHKTIADKDVSTTAPYAVAIPIITTDELSASMFNNVYIDGDEFLYGGFKLSNGEVSVGAWNNEFMYRGLADEKILPFPSEPDEEDLYCRVAITDDTNEDGQMDWQDGANALKKLTSDAIPGGHTAARRFFHVGYNFASGAQQPFMKVADNMKRLSNYMDGFGQNLVFKGYANEGHDSGHADYEDVNKRAGGAEGMNVAIAEADKINSDFGIHINNAEAYPEAKMFNDHVMANMDGWRWMDQSRYIRRDVDMIEGTFDARLDALYDQTPDLDFVYVDCWEGDRWGELKLVGNLLRNGCEMFATENAPDLHHFGVLVHSTGGTSSNGIHQFVYNTQKDIYPSSSVYWGGYNRGASMMSWQHNNNINTMVEQFYTNQLPQKYLMCHDILKHTGNAAVFEGNVTSSNWVITKDGNKITDGQGKIFIPWYAEESETQNPDEAAKIYHWNSNGGETTWSLPESWSNLENVYLYQTTQTGKKLVDTIKVTDGQVTIDAKARTPYVVYPGEAKADVTEWSAGSQLKDTGFNSRDFSIWKKAGDADIQFNDDGNGVSILTMTGEKSGQVSQTMEGLEPGQKYRVLTYAGSENGKTARLIVETPDGATHENYVDQICMNNQYFDNYAKNKPVQLMWVDFVQPEGETTAKVTLLADACDSANGKVTFMENRIVKTAEPDLEEKYVANETFEYVEQGAYGIFNPERSADGVPHLSETHLPYTNDTISGDWSLKLYGHYGQGDVTVRTSPATMRLKPNTEYEMEFDTLGDGRVYVQSESEGSNQVLNEGFAAGHSSITFSTEDKEDYIVRIERGRVLDNFTVKEVGPAGTTVKIPGKVEAENYLNMDGLTIAEADDGSVITDIGSGDWAEYKVRIAAADNYDVSLRVNIPAEKTAKFELTADGEKVKTISLPSTNGEWRTLKYNLTLPKEAKTLKITALTGDWQLNWMDFAYDMSVPSYKIQAEDFTNQEGTQLDPVEDSSDDSNQGLGYIDTGDWMEYEVELPEAGTYQVDYRVSVNGQGSNKKVGFAVNGETVKETVLPDTGGWQSWTTVSDTVEIKEAGTQTIRLNVIEGSWNINWFKLTLVCEEKADKSDLEELIVYAKTQQTNPKYQYLIPAVKTLFEKTLADAEIVFNTRGVEQAEVDAAYDTLLAKVHLLDFTGNTESLKVLVDAAEAKYQQEEMYTKESWEPFAKAFEAAQKLLEDENALQAEIDVAREALQAAMDALVLNPINTKKLEKLVADSKQYEDNIGNYTSDSAKAFTAALKGAREVLAGDELTQEAIDSAYTTLRNAIFGLRELPNKDKLGELLGKVEAMDLSVYSEGTAKAVKAAYAQAVAAFEDENADQKKVDAAVAALEEAVAAANAETGKGDVSKEDGTSKNEDGSGKDNKVASDNAGSKGTTNKTAGKSAAKTGDGANVETPMAAGLVAILAAVIAWKKKEN